jgi:AbrB family looped-hinge helix DNA binding protein
MAKITSKYQVTVPRKIADQFHIRPGDDIQWVAAGETIRIITSRKQESWPTREDRLRSFDQATERQKKRRPVRPAKRPLDRGWSREDLYHRGRSR